MRSTRFAASAVLAASLLGRPAGAGERDDVAHRFAPVLYQEVRDDRDLFAAFDFDGNWNGDDNAENARCWYESKSCNTGSNPNSTCANQKCPLVATVYYGVIETKTHYFIQYLPYHPIDAKLTNGHEHDTESVFAVVRKDGATGRLEAIETRFHTEWFAYAADQSVTAGAGRVHGPIHFDGKSGRPAVYSQMVGHGLCGGYSPPNHLFPDLALLCDHNGAPHVDRTGVRYTPDLAPSMPAVQSGLTVDAGYRLVPLEPSLWARRYEIGPGRTYRSAIDFAGDRCNQFDCPKQFGGDFQGNEGETPGEPWAQEGGAGATATGSQFFDPAFTMSRRLKIPAPFSLDYCFNPYLSIPDGCTPPPPDLGGSPDGGAGPMANKNSPVAGCALSPAHGDPTVTALGFALALVCGLHRRLRRTRTGGKGCLMTKIIALVPFLVGSMLTGCAMPTTAIVDGKEVPRQTLKYTGNPYTVTHIAAHPRPSKGLEDHGGRITGPICGNDVDYEVKHEGDHILMNGFVDAHFSSVIEVRDQNGERIIAGNFGTGAGTSVIDLRLRSDGLVGRVGFREFNLKQDGDTLVGLLRQGTNLAAKTIIAGRTEMWSMPAAAQAVILANLLTCKGEWISRDGRRQLDVTFGGRAGFSPRNTSTLYEGMGRSSLTDPSAQ